MRTLSRFGRMVMLAIGWAILAAPASAQKYPDHPIKLIVPVPPGGGVDILARAIGQKMSVSMGVPVVVENNAGASAAIGTEVLAKSPPDGYTIMMGYSAHATNPIFSRSLPYDTEQGFCRDRARRLHPADPRGERGLAVQVGEGADRARQGEARASCSSPRAARARARICRASC